MPSPRQRGAEVVDDPLGAAVDLGPIHRVNQGQSHRQTSGVRARIAPATVAAVSRRSRSRRAGMRPRQRRGAWSKERRRCRSFHRVGGNRQSGRERPAPSHADSGERQQGHRVRPLPEQPQKDPLALLPGGGGSPCATSAARAVSPPSAEEVPRVDGVPDERLRREDRSRARGACRGGPDRCPRHRPASRRTRRAREAGSRGSARFAVGNQPSAPSTVRLRASPVSRWHLVGIGADPSLDDQGARSGRRRGEQTRQPTAGRPAVIVGERDQLAAGLAPPAFRFAEAGGTPRQRQDPAVKSIGNLGALRLIVAVANHDHLESAGIERLLGQRIEREGEPRLPAAGRDHDADRDLLLAPHRRRSASRTQEAIWALWTTCGTAQPSRASSLKRPLARRDRIPRSRSASSRCGRSAPSRPPTPLDPRSSGRRRTAAAPAACCIPRPRRRCRCTGRRSARGRGTDRAGGSAPSRRRRSRSVPSSSGVAW